MLIVSTLMEIIKLVRRGQFIFKTLPFKGVKRFSLFPKNPYTNLTKLFNQRVKSKMEPTQATDISENLPPVEPEDPMLQEEENKVKSISKKSITFANFKMHKKLAQGIKVVCKIENKKFGEIVTQTPTKNLIFIHFGQGDEDDYEGLSDFLEKFGKSNLHVIPGIPYGIVEFEEIAQAESVINTTTKVPDNIVANSCEIKFGQKVRNVFFFYTNLAANQLQRQRQTDIPDSSSKIEIPDLTVIPDFVTPEEEQALMKEVDKNKWNPLAQRRVQHYGYDFIYGLNTVDKNKYIGSLPEFVPGVVARINETGQKYNKADFDQLTIDDYFPGQGIPPHIDPHSSFEECVVSLNLGSGVVMSFKDDKNVVKNVFIPPRSLIIYTGAARYACYRSIASRKLDRVDGNLFFRKRRISLTFRKVKQDPCQCKWLKYCDSQSTNALPAFEEHKKADKSDEEDAEEIEIQAEEEYKGETDKTKLSEWEKKYVYNTYEKIAPHFSSTRYKPWPKVAKFLKELPFGSIVADVGCGNGKYLPVNQENLYTIGTDRSTNLVEICKSRDYGFQVFSADSLRLPLRNECADFTISIAVIHHFSNKIQAIKELTRITRKGGKILIYVWAFEQDGKKFTQQDVLVPWHLQFKFEDEDKISNLLAEKTETNSNAGEGSQKGTKSEVSEKNKEEEKKEDTKKENQEDNEEDIHVDEAKKTVVYKRYYHMFKNGELEELVKEIPELEVEQSFYDHANWCVILRRKM